MDKPAGAFQHQVNKASLPVCPILGVQIAAIDMPWLLDFTQRNLKALSGDYICVSNVHTTVTAFKDPGYMQVQNGGILAIPDGGPLSTTGRRRGFRAMRRVTGPDYMQQAIAAGISKGWRHYFYGSTPETLEKMEQNLRARYPGIEISGTFSPPFRPIPRRRSRPFKKSFGKSSRTSSGWVWEPPSRRFGCTTTRARFPGSWWGWGPPLTMRRKTSTAPRTGCSGTTWNGSIGCCKTPSGCSPGISTPIRFI